MHGIEKIKGLKALTSCTVAGSVRTHSFHLVDTRGCRKEESKEGRKNGKGGMQEGIKRENRRKGTISWR